MAVNYSWNTLAVRCIAVLGSLVISGAARADFLTEWNNQELTTIRTTSIDPLYASRGLAILQVAMFDAINGVSRQDNAFYYNQNAPAGTSLGATMAAVGLRVLNALHGTNTAFTNLYNAQIASLTDSPTAISLGIAWGNQVADFVLAIQASDGAAASNTSYTPTGVQGDWAPTPPANAAPLRPGWSTVIPFALNTGAQFRPNGPPALDALLYVTDFNQVKSLGQDSSVARTADQTNVANFWNDAPGTVTTAGHWNQAVHDLTATFSIHDKAKVFAAVNIAMADASIAAWDAKFTYIRWRPVTAIRDEATRDTGVEYNHPSITGNAAWSPLIATEASPEYVSMVSTMSTAAVTVLSELTGGDSRSFSISADTNGDGTADMTRIYTSLSQASNEAGMSGVYGGSQFNSSVEDGKSLGQTVGQHITNNFFTPVVVAPESVATLSSLTLSSGSLVPGFDSSNITYSVTVPNATSSLTVTPTTTKPLATVKVNGATVTSGTASDSIALAVGSNSIIVQVTAENGTTIITYTVNVTRSILSPTTTTASATAITTTGATLNGTVNANGLSTTVTFEYGPTTGYGTSVAATPSPVTGSSDTSVSAALSSLSPGTTYHYRVKGVNTLGGTGLGDDGTFTTLSNVATLSGLDCSAGSLAPEFSSATTGYSISVPNSTTSVTVTPTTTQSQATVTVNSGAVTSGSASAPVNLDVGSNDITVQVTAQDGVTTKTYTITVTRSVVTPSVTSGAATTITIGGATLNGTVNANNFNTTPSFEYGLTTAYGSSATAAPSPVTGNAGTAVSAVVSGLSPGTTYHYRVKGINTLGGSSAGDDATFTTLSNVSTLSSLATSDGVLSPVFASATGSYNVAVSNATASITVTPTVTHSQATVTVNGNAVTSGSASGAINLNVGSNTITVLVTAQDGSTTKTYTLTVTRSVVLPTVVTSAASSVTATAATLNGTVNANNLSSAVSFEYGPTTSYGSSATATPSPVTGSSDTSVSAALSGLSSGTTYHYRVKGVNSLDGSSVGEDGTFTTLSTDATLSGIALSAGTLSPAFAGATISYTAAVPYATTSVTVTPTVAQSQATVTVNSTAVTSGSASGAISLAVGSNTITLVVTAQDGSTTKTYTLTVTRAQAVPHIVVEQPADTGLVDGTASIAFGNSNVGSTSNILTFTIKNTGTADLTGLSVTMDGSHAADFIPASLSATTLAPNASMTLSVVFNPKAPGSRSAVMHIASNHEEKSPFDIVLSGTGIINRTVVGTTAARPLWKRPEQNGASAPVALSTTATAVPHEVISFNVSAAGTYTLTSTATSPAGWDNYLFLYNNSFSPLAQLTNVIIGNDNFPGVGTAGYTVSLQPGITYFAVNTGKANTNAGAYSLLISGPGYIAVGPEIAVEQPVGTELVDGSASIPFGVVNGGSTSATTSFTIKNKGTANLTGLVISKVGTNINDFIVSTTGMSTTLLPGASTTFTVRFAPFTSGPKTAVLRVASNDSDENPYDITLTGTCFVPIPGKLVFGSAFITVNEEAGTVNIPVNRTDGTDGAVSVLVSTSNGTAIAGSDYSAVTNQLVTWATGDNATKLVPVTILNPAVTNELNETFNVTLSVPTGGSSLGVQKTATVVINDSVDTIKPGTPVISLPAASAKVNVNPGGTVTVTGTATDNQRAAVVEVSLNNGPFVAATVTPTGSGSAFGSTANYSINVIPALGGANSVVARTIDGRGNVSSVSAPRSFFVLRPLPVNIVGSGSVSAGYAPTSFREVGKSYSITATPAAAAAPGFAFNGWTVSGGPTLSEIGVTPIALEMPALTFIYREGLVLTANFIPNPFASTVTGSFNGLIKPSPTLPAPGASLPSNETVGKVTATVGSNGAFSGKLFIDGMSLSFAGVFDNTGVARFGVNRATTFSVVRTIRPSYDLALQLDLNPAGTNKITGTLTQKVRGIIKTVSTVDADRAFYNGTTVKVPAKFAGTLTKPYTAFFPAKSPQGGGLTAADYPQGDGHANVTVHINGTVSLTGKLADGTVLSISAPLSKNNTWPLFQQLYPVANVNGGSLAGQVALDETQADSDMAGTNVWWFRPYQDVQHYPYGWPAGITTDLKAAAFSAVTGVSVLPGLGATPNNFVPNADLELLSGPLPASIAKKVNISTADVVTKTVASDISYSLLVTRSNGAFSGTFTSNTGTKPAFTGVIYQKGSLAGGHGYFLSVAPTVKDYTGQGGVAMLHPIASPPTGSATLTGIYSETYSESIVSTLPPGGGAMVHQNVPKTSGSFTVTATLPAGGLPAVDANTDVAVSLDQFSHAAKLGDATANGGSLSLSLRQAIFKLPAATLTYKWTANTVTVTGTFNLPNSIDAKKIAGDKVEGEPLTFPYAKFGSGVGITFGSLSGARDLYTKGSWSLVKKTVAPGDVRDLRGAIVSGTTDYSKPVCAITSPLNNARILNSVGPNVTVTGTASDGVALDKVKVWLNGQPLAGTDAALVFNLLSPTTVATWSLSIAPVPGPNRIEAKSYDKDGNESAVVAVNFNYVVPATLNLSLNGTGTVATGFAGATSREVGVTYNVTATPGAGFVFDQWIVTGASLAQIGITNPSALEVPSLKFVHQEGLNLTAKFIVNPFTPAVTGSFNGLIMPSATLPAPGASVRSNNTVGMVKATVGGTGALSGTLLIDGMSLGFAGVIDNTGVARFGSSRATTLTVTRANKPSYHLALNLDLNPAGTNKITGTLSQKLRGVVTSVSDVNADRAFYNATAPKVPVNYAGTSSKAYTVVFPAKDLASQPAGFTAADYPQGDGYATVSVNINGTVSVTGKLADGTAISASAPLSKSNKWPLFHPLYSVSGATRGCIAGMVTLDDTQAESDLSGANVLWFRPFQLAQWYPYGWDEGIVVDAIGAKYVVPPALPATSVFPGPGPATALKVVDLVNGNVSATFSDGLLSSSITRSINISPTNVVTKPTSNTDAGFTMALTSSNGLLSGVFTHTDTTKPAFQGVIIQKGTQRGAYGYFMTKQPVVIDYKGESGGVSILAKP